MPRAANRKSRKSGTSRSAGTKHAPSEIEELRARLEEAESIVEAIQSGGVDALVVKGPEGESVFVLEGADYPYRIMLDVMSEGVVTLGADGGILSCNSRFAAFVKTPVDRILGTPLARFVTPGDKPKLATFLREAFKKSGTLTVALALPDGTSVPVNLSTGVLEAAGLPALCIVVTNLTEILAGTEARLQLASIVETSNDAIVTKSLDNTILTWNAAAERIYGFSVHEAVGRSISIIAPRERSQEIERINEEICLGQRREDYETVHVAKSGARINVSLTFSPLRDPNGSVTGVSIIARDITDRKKTEAELEEYRRHLQEMVGQRTGELDAANAGLAAELIGRKEADEQIRCLNDELQKHVAVVDAMNEELESYSHSVSHDLRAPLRFVDRIAHLLLDESGATLSTSAVRQVKMILQATNEMAQLITHLLVFSQVSRKPMSKRRVDLRRLVQEALKELQQAQEGRCIDLVVRDLPPCHCDRTLMKEVVANLLENAFKFTRHRKKARITIGCAESQEETVYFVQDNGIGFDKSHADSLFAPFFRLHKAADFEGTGIGLALVKRIVERHGGRVWAVGKVEKGATFYFALGKETGE